MLNDYMKRWVAELELPPSLAESRGSVFQIPMDEETIVEVKELAPGLSFYCKVSPCPEKGREQFYMHMLYGNLLGQGTDGAALGLTEEGNYLTLSYVMGYPVEYAEFKDIVEDFFNAVDFWREEARLHKAGKLFPS